MMLLSSRWMLVIACGLSGAIWPGVVLAQAPPAEVAKELRSELQKLQQQIADETNRREAEAEKTGRRMDRQSLADAQVFAKAVEWILRHEEFYKPNYIDQTRKVLKWGRERTASLAEGKTPWRNREGSTVYGYVSKVDGSVQPYAITLPQGVDPQAGKRWPLYVKLHGRAATMNEVNFITRYENKPTPAEQTWIQLDVFGRTNNAYRFAGETDVFEAIADVESRFRIDDKRITLWGFSMGGAGAWHLGLHHPSKWASVGAGAGFVDFYKYQKQSKKLPPYQDKTLTIYDAEDYALNAADVPIITYGGEVDSQLVASTNMVQAAKKLHVEIPLLIGKGMGHKFSPAGYKDFMAFHAEHSKTGRPGYPGRKKIRFITYTLKYPKCEWLTIQEMNFMYQPATVEGEVTNEGVLKLMTKNVAVLAIARDTAQDIELDGRRLPLQSAADGLLPDVYYERGEKGWIVLDYNESRRYMANPNRSKRHNLQGPIDDAFMLPFVCVEGTGTPWSKEQSTWANWTLEPASAASSTNGCAAKFPSSKIPNLPRTMMEDKNLILFGDPGSNKVLAKVLDKLPIEWTKDSLKVGGKTWDPKTHGLSMIYPNPLNPAAVHRDQQRPHVSREGF